MTDEEQRLLLCHEVGLQVIEQYGKLPVLDQHRGRVKFPRCPHCRRRPELVKGARIMLLVKTGLPEPQAVNVPRYEIFPCCSAKYIHTVEGPTR